MKSVRGTETEKNLLASFAGESQARNRYTYFASKAREEGFVQMALIFEETANQEREHAKRFFGFLEGGDLSITSSFPAGRVGSTKDNLAAAAAGENFEWKELYPSFAEKARAEGFEAVATVFEAVMVAEKQHARRYEKLLSNVERGKVFTSESTAVWRCTNCGYLFEGKEAPKVCPACLHPQAYFELLGENY